MSRVQAYVGLGSNQESPGLQVESAARELERLPESAVRARSGLYRTAPQGWQAQPEFINAVLRLETSLAPQRLLAALQEIERRHGRVRSFANAPRTLDLDLLLYGDRLISETGLQVPHPRLHTRAFVLIPLLELDPQLDIPGRGPARDWLAACAGQPVTRLDPPPSGCRLSSGRS